MNKEFISIVQIILGIILSVFILVQSKGSGLGSTFGGEMGLYRTKRGFEKLLFRATIVIAFLFLLSATYGLLL